MYAWHVRDNKITNNEDAEAVAEAVMALSHRANIERSEGEEE